MDERLARVEEQVKNIAAGMERVNEVLTSVADSLCRLAVIEEKHNNVNNALGRAFTAIDGHDLRLGEIEKNLPYLKLASGWVFKAVILVMALLGAAALSIVLKGGGLP